RGGSGCSITKLGCASTIVAGATSRVAVGAMACCAPEGPADNNAAQPIIAANDKSLIRDLHCMNWFPFVLVVCPPEFPGRSCKFVGIQKLQGAIWVIICCGE